MGAHFNLSVADYDRLLVFRSVEFTGKSSDVVTDERRCRRVNSSAKRSHYPDFVEFTNNGVPVFDYRKLAADPPRRSRPSCECRHFPLISSFFC